MTSLLIAISVFFGFFREIWDLIKQPKYRALLIWVVVLLAIGTVFFSQVEGWEILDSLYFSVVTLATVGYGDFSPETAAGKVFAMVYMLFGLSILASFVSMMAKERQVIHAQRFGDSEKEGE
ncbi:MAG TPA: potassium channel family protein [candidate division Zixibacteria bacterium]|nr:potassium channel family protein [candidate division Zixibacteria bacterium]